jgi:hypothetical protein
MNAARDLRRQDSDTKLSVSASNEKLPQLSKSSSMVRKPPTAPRQKALDASYGDHSGSIDDDAVDQTSYSTNSTMGRVGLRRCAMMYRLLSAVPEDVLVRELSECGVDATTDMDQESLIEAVIRQLS